MDGSGPPPMPDMSLSGLSPCSLEEQVLNNHAPNRMAFSCYNMNYRIIQKKLEKLYRQLLSDKRQMAGTEPLPQRSRRGLSGRSEETAMSEGALRRHHAFDLPPEILASLGCSTEDDDSFNYNGYVREMRAILRQLVECQDLEMRLLKEMQDRISTTMHLCDAKRPNIIHAYRLIAEYMLRRGHFAATQALVEKFGIQEEFSLLGYRTLVSIRESLLARDIKPFMCWARVNRVKIAEFENKLENSVHLLKAYDEVERAAEVAFTPRGHDYYTMLSNAIQYIRDNVKTDNIENDMEAQDTLTNVMRMFVIPPELAHLPHTEPNRCGLSWPILANDFTRYYFHAHQIGLRDPFETTLEAGLMVTRSPDCGRSGRINAACPTCHPTLNQLAKNLPLPSRQNSMIICRLTNDLIDENNPGLMTPGGRVYGTRGVRKNMRSDGTFTCPYARVQCRVVDMKKVYFL